MVWQEKRNTEQSHKRYFHLSNAVVIFCDISGFQGLNLRYGDESTFAIVTTLFSKFERIARFYHVHPVKTNGDQFIGLCLNSYAEGPFITQTGIEQKQKGSERALLFAKSMQSISSEHIHLTNLNCGLRIGIAQGNVLLSESLLNAGAIDIWGNTVNRAAMLERHTQVNSTALDKRAMASLPCVQSAELNETPLNTKIGTVTAYCYQHVKAPSPSNIDIKNILGKASNDSTTTCRPCMTGKYRVYH
ncbi:adenylate/guanylate cyclase domain-containing protein [Alteromonas sp. McT4-15]|jgi:class 3 adenylate cyclase|uniref:adenylate/guanylate cyclase domain-containing protein n=1 Tax=Alteromonas sp. McT4-15 TaxID=2881256 RepID=UPI001CF83035|nr:adenylate/guanylate cyclase domain-containing protein [Alteromonas sp. McT4-15]MCB4437368.1 adenylate/guanylate cyclase domain-containing protein [Alteromonas sp. McT4-15]